MNTTRNTPAITIAIAVLSIWSFLGAVLIWLVVAPMFVASADADGGLMLGVVRFAGVANLTAALLGAATVALRLRGAPSGQMWTVVTLIIFSFVNSLVGIPTLVAWALKERSRLR